MSSATESDFSRAENILRECTRMLYEHPTGCMRPFLREDAAHIIAQALADERTRMKPDCMSVLDTLRAEIESRRALCDRNWQAHVTGENLTGAERAEARVQTYDMVLDMIGRLSADPEHAAPKSIHPRQAAVIQQLRTMMARVWRCIDRDGHEPCDCVCHPPFGGEYQNAGHALTFMEKAVSAAIAKHEAERASRCGHWPMQMVDCMACMQSGADGAQARSLFTIASDLPISDQRALLNLARRLQDSIAKED